MYARLRGLLSSTLVFSALLLLSACGGSSGGGSSGNDNTDPETESSTSIQGTAATGAAIDGSIYLRDSDGNPGDSIAYTIEEDGSFAIEVTEFEPPFLLKARPDDGSMEQFSFAAETGLTNITPLTTLAMFEAHGRGDLRTLFDDWGDRSDIVNETVNQSQLQIFSQILAQQFSSQLEANEINPDRFSFFTTPFAANNTGFDAVLDELSVAFDLGNGTVDVNGEPFRLDGGDAEPPDTTPPISDGGSCTFTASLSGPGVSADDSFSGAQGGLVLSLNESGYDGIQFFGDTETDTETASNLTALIWSFDTPLPFGEAGPTSTSITASLGSLVSGQGFSSRDLSTGELLPPLEVNISERELLDFGDPNAVRMVGTISGTVAVVDRSDFSVVEASLNIEFDGLFTFSPPSSTLNCDNISF